MGFENKPEKGKEASGENSIQEVLRLLKTFSIEDLKKINEKLDTWIPEKAETDDKKNQ